MAKLKLERPGPSSYARIAAGEMPLGGEDWVAAAIACARGDHSSLGAYLQGAAWRGEAEAVQSRRVTSIEVGRSVESAACLGGTTAHYPGLLGRTLQARGCATHSGRASQPLRVQWEATSATL